ncbi:orotate phosphoribosyltransferase [Roseiflexus castenholzii]|uniref:Orotate phosphoribosyltransferase n=1 Tax=Roseiflexus castenholzii (strain DSM 13941 / HLO8) TaxID=383372 RepID=A7NKQ5_ROSCS|nr:orotate phosphoribosyltransferase [Roseiflexus castenholzii]ABU58075.1 orotate phosphoribosyltransferase [Roseiflexus castenholzii DSM 13941]
MTTDIAYEIAATLLEAGALLIRPREPFIFASGLRSPIYCDNRMLLGDVAARRIVTRGFAAQCADAQVVAGPATGGIAWAAWVAEALSIPMAYVRSGAKGHGRGRQVEGATVRDRRVALLEDTVSTGESALQAADALRAEGALVTHCVCIFTWGWADTEARFAAAHLHLVPLATLPAVLDVAQRTGRLTPEARALVESWAANPRAWMPPEA